MGSPRSRTHPIWSYSLQRRISAKRMWTRLSITLPPHGAFRSNPWLHFATCWSAGSSKAWMKRHGTPGPATRPILRWATCLPAPPSSALTHVRWRVSIAHNTTKSLASINKGLPARLSPRLVIVQLQTITLARPRCASPRNRFSPAFEIEPNFDTELNRNRIMSTNKLAGKIALITGGSSGLGLATAKQFIAEGAYVFITGRRQPELDAAAKEIGSNVTTIRGDIANLADLDRLFATIKEQKGRLDILFANAGGGAFEPLGQVTEANFDKYFAINVKGTVFTVQKALPL